LRLARDGADIVLFDVCADVKTVSYPMAHAADLEQTASDVEALGRRCLAVEGDVRDRGALDAAVERAVAELGHVDIVLANAGVASYHKTSVMPDNAWHTVIDINLSGVYNTVRATLPHLIERRYGRIIATSSTMGRMGAQTGSHYAASKWGVIGFIKSVALEVGALGITANCVAPGTIDTPLIQNDEIYRLFYPDHPNPQWDDVAPRFAALNPMGIPHLDVSDVSEAIAFLASDAARYITGAVLDISAGKSASWTA
jgi:SDR family mycofactocin-dependent oxidoreductase